MINSEQIELIKDILTPYNPKELGVFGSYSRNQNNKESDLDLLVDFEKRVNLFDLIGIEQELSDRLMIKVDLVTKNSLSYLIKDYVENDLISLI
jgi:hypothetical protein